MKKNEVEGKRRGVRNIIKGMKAEIQELLAKFKKEKGEQEEKGEILVEKDEIFKIIPYDPEKVYLEKVIITDDKVTGELLVTEEVCSGHRIGGQLVVFRGIDIAEMAAQLLGVWAAKYLELKFKTTGGLAFLKRFIAEVPPPTFRVLSEASDEIPQALYDVKLMKQVYPGDRLIVEITTDNIGFGFSGRSSQAIIMVTGEEFLASVVGKEKIGVIFRIELPLIGVKSLAE